MEYLQYEIARLEKIEFDLVLNLVINGIPSIQNIKISGTLILECFKPCYKWNTFNTLNTKISDT